MKIHKKSLQHVSKTLDSFDKYPTYKSINIVLTEAGIDNALRLKILDRYETDMEEQAKKVRDAKDWVDTIISDIQ